MKLDWCVESCDRIIGEIDICIFMDYRFGGRSDMLDIQISDTFMNNKSVAKIQQIMSMAWQFDLWKSKGFTFHHLCLWSGSFFFRFREAPPPHPPSELFCFASHQRCIWPDECPELLRSSCLDIENWTLDIGY